MSTVSEQIIRSGLVTGARVQHFDHETHKLIDEFEVDIVQPLLNDLCPVCGVRNGKHNGVFCSHDCEARAHNFRRRMGTTLKNMRLMGFDCSYSNGIIITTKIPDFVLQYYPEGAHSFSFPLRFVNIDMMKPEHYFDELGCCMGGVIGHYARLLNRNETFWGEHVNETFERMVKFVYDDAFNTFECASCNQRFIKSDYGFTKTIHVCSGCVYEAEHF